MCVVSEVVSEEERVGSVGNFSMCNFIKMKFNQVIDDDLTSK